MSFGVPITSDFDDYSFTINLDGTIYELAFRWNSRKEKWFVSMSLEDGTPIVGMRPVIADWPPFARFRNASLPPGELMFIDTSGQNIDPGHDDLGSRVLLIYLEEVDVAA